MRSNQQIDHADFFSANEVDRPQEKAENQKNQNPMKENMANLIINSPRCQLLFNTGNFSNF